MVTKMLNKHEFIQQASVEILAASRSENRQSYPTADDAVTDAENLWEALEKRGYSHIYKARIA